MSGPEKALKHTCTCKLNSTSLERKPAACAVPLFRFLQVTGGTLFSVLSLSSDSFRWQGEHYFLCCPSLQIPSGDRGNIIFCAVPLFRFLQVTGRTLFSVLYAGVCATPRASPPSAPCCATQQTPAAWRQTAAPRPPLSRSPLRSQDPPWPHPSATSPQWPHPVPTPPSPPSTPLWCLGSVSALFWADSQRWVGYFYTLGNKVGGGGYIRIAVCLSAVGVGVGYCYTLGNRDGGGGLYQNCCLSVCCWCGGGLFLYPGLYQNCCLSVHPSICLCIQLCSRRFLLTYKPFVTKLVFWEGGWRLRYCVCAFLNTYYLCMCVC